MNTYLKYLEWMFTHDHDTWNARTIQVRQLLHVLTLRYRKNPGWTLWRVIQALEQY